jgi:hypothetical protein
MRFYGNENFGDGVCVCPDEGRRAEGSLRCVVGFVGLSR